MFVESDWFAATTAPGLAPTGISGLVYDVTRDGQRFLLKREVEPSPIYVVSNWDARLSR
jgi:hypothetical protein